jgi:hypothetical protein
MKSLAYLLLLVSTSLFAQKEINTEQISEKNAIQSFKEFYEMLSS